MPRYRAPDKHRETYNDIIRIYLKNVFRGKRDRYYFWGHLYRVETYGSRAGHRTKLCCRFCGNWVQVWGPVIDDRPFHARCRSCKMEWSGIDCEELWEMVRNNSH